MGTSSGYQHHWELARCVNSWPDPRPRELECPSVEPRNPCFNKTIVEAGEGLMHISGLESAGLGSCSAKCDLGDQWHWHSPGVGEKYRPSGPTPDLLSKNLHIIQSPGA